MLRDIKFRGQTRTTEGKKWVYGNYYKVKNFFNDKVGHFIGMIRGNHLNDFSIDENTLGQYTGLKDKNGKEIYEGDIIEWTTLSGKKYRFSVEYSNKYAQYIVVNTGDASMEYEPLGDYENIEVIGNVWENSDLLKGE